MQPEGCVIFSATKFRDRENLGNHVTDWIRKHPEKHIISTDVRQSSDSEFHCLSIVIWFREKPK